MLAGQGVEDERRERLVRALGTDPATAEVGPADRAMLAYALKLTATPDRITRGDVESLRTVGFDDRAIHDICAVTAYYAFVNRIADGLGVELEPDRSERRSGS